MSRIYPINVNDYPRLSQDEEKQYLSQFKNPKSKEDKQAACDVLVCHNIGLIYSVINNACKDEPQKKADMVSYGVEGFIIALDKYDMESNAKLTTYAYNWVFKKVIEGKRADTLVRFPESIWDGIAKYTVVSERFHDVNDEWPTNKPFSDECCDGYISDMEKALVVDAENPMALSTYKLVVTALEKKTMLSFDSPIADGSQTTLEEVVEDKKASLEDDFRDERQAKLRRAIDIEFEKMGESIGKKGNDAIDIFKLKLQGLSSAEIQRRLGMTRGVERTLEKKGLEFLQKSPVLRELALQLC